MASSTESSVLLADFLDKVVSIITNDGRHITGILRGFDQLTNVVIEEGVENVYSLEEPVRQRKIGVFLARGDNIVLVGDYHQRDDVNLEVIFAEPLQTISH